jgi:predicted nucleic acid-binding protein
VILYLDSSALIKLYIEEAGSSAVRAAVNEAAAVCTHLIAYAEVRAGLAKPMRMGRLTEQQVEFQVGCVEMDWPSARVVGVTESLVRRAGDLAHRHALRGYDSVHLAAAEEVYRVVDDGRMFRFAAFDAALAAAGRALGMRLLGD